MDTSSNIPHQYCSYNNYPELFGLSTPMDDAGKLLDAINGENMINNIMVPSILNYDDISSPVAASLQFGVSDSNIVVPQMSEIEFGSFSDNFAVCDFNQLHHEVFEPGEDQHSGLMVPNFCPANYNPMPAAPENWGIIQGKSVEKVDQETVEVKVGRYSVEERKDRIQRYLKKRNQRNFNKTIKYACRKTLADKRVRVRGRFAKNNEQEEMAMMNTSDHDTNCYEVNNSLYYNDEDYYSSQMKYCDEDYWFQAAMANLVHLPYLAS